MRDRVRYEDGLHIHTGNWPSERLAPLQDVRAPVALETERRIEKIPKWWSNPISFIFLKSPHGMYTSKETLSTEILGKSKEPPGLTALKLIRISIQFSHVRCQLRSALSVPQS